MREDVMKSQMIDKFKESGLKLTPQRLAIFEFLDGRTDHPSADAIYKGIREKHPTISYATVYNTVEAMRDVGALLEIGIDSGRRHYDPNTETHHHAICTECGRILDVFADMDLEPMLPKNVQSEFIVNAVNINFYGLCTECSKK